jgi:hypothetical protein
MQDRGDARFCGRLQPFRISGKSQQCICGRPEQEREDLARVAVGEAVQLARQGEDEVKVVDGQNAIQTRLDPSGLFQGLALRTMPISAGIIGRLFEAAGGAAVEMTAERRGSAGDEGADCALLSHG